MTDNRTPFLSGEDGAQDAGPYVHGVQRLLAQALQVPKDAMIATTARQSVGRLIAMSRIRAPHVFSSSHECGSLGFAEDPNSLLVKPTREGRSTKGNPQSCGKTAAGAFDVVGLAAYLRRRFPRYTATNVEAETGISAASVENWLQYRSQPSVEHFSILILTFGPSLLRAAMKDDADWLVRAEKDALADELADEIAALERRRNEIIRSRA